MEMMVCRGWRLVSNLSPRAITNFPIPVRFARYPSLSWRSKLPEECPYYRSRLRTYLTLSNQQVAKHHVRSGITRFVSKYSPPEAKPQVEKKVTLLQKLKQMTKNYWHVVIPVHIITSIGWMVGFYMVVKNGVDISKLVEKVSLSEEYIETIKNSDAGNWAIAYVLYKIFTPLRYMVTIGGSTMAIQSLRRMGYLKTKKPILASQSNKSTVGQREVHRNKPPEEPPKT